MTAARLDLATFALLPLELTERQQWVVWSNVAREGAPKPTKIPFDPKTGGAASTTDHATWSSYGKALEAYAADPERYDGVGFVFTKDDPCVGIDLDNSLDDAGELLPWAAELLATIPSYGEISPSGRGVKIIGRAKLPEPGTGINRKGCGPDGSGGTEIYGHGRFFTITGRRHHACPSSIQDIPATVELYERLRRKPQPSQQPKASRNGKAGAAPLDRCLKYFAKMPDAISGSGGHNATFAAACVTVKFDLSEPQQWEAMQWWNHNKCGGEPWADRDIQHKIESANREAQGERGSLLKTESPENQNHNSNGLTPPAGVADFPLTDAGNGERLMHRHGDKLRFAPLWNKWLLYDGKRWLVDETGAADRLAIETIRELGRLGAKMAQSDDEDAHVQGVKILRYAHGCESHRKIKDMLARAERVKGTSIMPNNLDRDPWLLNVGNGTLDLRTGKLRPHQREDFITKICSVDYDPSATAPALLVFLDRTFQVNGQLIAFVQRAVGYTLTGITFERAFFILYGSGANGKSTLLSLIRDLLGEYATQTAPDTIMAKRFEGIPNDVARLKGARFVSVTESDEGRCLAEGLVKRMTGGEDVLTARFMRAEYFDFSPEFKLFLATNHRPIIRGQDPAIWDRLMLIPFDVRIPENERDKNLSTKLRAELPGVLNWALQGCLEWQRDGLSAPAEVKMAVEDYKANMDRLADFVTDCCTVGNGLVASAADLYAIYKGWAKFNGEEPMNQTKFGRQLSDRGYPSGKDNRGRKQRLGIGLQENAGRFRIVPDGLLVSSREKSDLQE